MFCTLSPKSTLLKVTTTCILVWAWQNECNARLEGGGVSVHYAALFLSEYILLFLSSFCTYLFALCWSAARRRARFIVYTASLSFLHPYPSPAHTLPPAAFLCNARRIIHSLTL